MFITAFSIQLYRMVPGQPTPAVKTYVMELGPPPPGDTLPDPIHINVGGTLALFTWYEVITTVDAAFEKAMQLLHTFESRAYDMAAEVGFSVLDDALFPPPYRRAGTAIDSSKNPVEGELLEVGAVTLPTRDLRHAIRMANTAATVSGNAYGVAYKSPVAGPEAYQAE